MKIGFIIKVVVCCKLSRFVNVLMINNSGVLRNLLILSNYDLMFRFFNRTNRKAFKTQLLVIKACLFLFLFYSNSFICFFLRTFFFCNSDMKNSIFITCFYFIFIYLFRQIKRSKKKLIIN